MSSTPTRGWLEVPDGRRVPLTTSLSIGRAAENGIVLNTDLASRWHALIHAQNGSEFWLVDFGGINGTSLNGNRVIQPTALQPGDRIRIAERDFLFRLDTNGGNGADHDGDDHGGPDSRRPVQAVPCWLLLADVEDFAVLKQRISPQALAVSMGLWFRTSWAAIAENGGAVNSYNEDGYLASWKDHPGVGQKVAATIAALRQIRETEGLRFRVVLHRGTALFRSLEADNVESVSGNDVNYLIRMERLAGLKGMSTMLSAAAERALKGNACCSAIAGSHEVPGFPGGHEFFCFDQLRNKN